MIRPRARLTNERGAASGSRNADGAFLLEALARYVVRAGGEQQISVLGGHGRGEPRELAICARAGFQILAGFHERRRIRNDEVERLLRGCEPLQLFEYVRFDELA